MGSIIRQEGGRASPERNEAVHQDVCGPFGCEFGRGNGKHVCTAAEAVREKEDVGISSSCYEQGPEIVNADGNARAVGQEDRENWPANCLAGGLTRLAFEAAAHPPPRADFHADPREKTFKHFEGACNTEMTGGIGVACVHDPRSGQNGHIDANGVIEGGPAEAGRCVDWAGGYCDGVADQQCRTVVTLDQAAFGGEIKYVSGGGTSMRGDVIA